MVTGYKSRPGGSHFTQAGAVIIFTNLSGSDTPREIVFFIFLFALLFLMIYRLLGVHSSKFCLVFSHFLDVFWPFSCIFALKMVTYRCFLPLTTNFLLHFATFCHILLLLGKFVAIVCSRIQKICLNLQGSICSERKKLL